VTVGGNERDEVSGYVGFEADGGGGGGHVGHVGRFCRFYHIIRTHHLHHIGGWFCDHLGGDMKQSSC